MDTMKRIATAIALAALVANTGPASANSCGMLRANLDVQMNMTTTSLNAFGAETQMWQRANIRLLKFHAEQIERHARQSVLTLESIKNIKGTCGIKKENIDKMIDATNNLIEKTATYGEMFEKN